MAAGSVTASGDPTDFLLHGAANKATAGARATQLQGIEAVAGNPANIGMSSSHTLYGELSWLSLDYTFSYPKQEPARVQLNTPVLFLGSRHPLTRDLSVAWSILPIPGGGSELKVDRLPSRALTEDPGLMNISTASSGILSYKLALGVAWRASPTLSFGASVLNNLAESSLVIADHESGTDLIELESTTTTIGGLLGATYQPFRPLRLGASWRSPLLHTLRGKALNAGGSSFRGAGRQGGAAALGATLQWKPAYIFAEVHHDDRDRDSGNSDVMMVLSKGELARHDTLSYVAGLGAQWKSHRIVASYAWYPTAIGDGIMATRDRERKEFIGAAFGDMNAISRNQYGLGYRWQRKHYTLDSAVASANGERNVPEWSRGYGIYQLQTYSASMALTWRL